jgi:hypothetical protein
MASGKGAADADRDQRAEASPPGTSAKARPPAAPEQAGPMSRRKRQKGFMRHQRERAEVGIEGQPSVPMQDPLLAIDLCMIEEPSVIPGVKLYGGGKP